MLLLLVSLLVTPAAPPGAPMIVITSGGAVRGTVSSQSEDAVVLELKGGELRTIPRSQIRSMFIAREPPAPPSRPRPRQTVEPRGDGLGIDARGLPFIKRGGAQTELDWADFYRLAGRPDLLEQSNRNASLKPLALGAGSAAVLGGVALAAYGLALGRQYNNTLPGDGGPYLVGFWQFATGVSLIQAGAISFLAGLFIGPRIGGLEDNLEVAQDHNAPQPGDPWEPSSAAPAKKSPVYALHLSPLVTPQAKGAAFSLSF